MQTIDRHGPIKSPAYTSHRISPFGCISELHSFFRIFRKCISPTNYRPSFRLQSPPEEFLNQDQVHGKIQSYRRLTALITLNSVPISTRFILLCLRVTSQFTNRGVQMGHRQNGNPPAKRGVPHIVKVSHSGTHWVTG
jgi:hypothetical protein